MKSQSAPLTHTASHVQKREDKRFQNLADERIPRQVDRVLSGSPELDYLIALSTDYVMEAQKHMNVDFRKVEAALQLIQQAYRLEAHMYAQEEGSINMPLGNSSKDLPVYTMPRRSHKVWEMGYYFGIICRSRVLMSDFRMLPYTRQFMQNNIFDEFRVIYYHFLRQLETPQADIFLKRSEQTLSKIPINFAGQYQSYVPLWRPILLGDEERLSMRLKELIDFRKVMGLHNQIETIIPLVAILSYAHDLGMRFDTYDLPADLITGHYAVDIDKQLEHQFQADIKVSDPRPKKARQ